ncbi:PXDN [Mytilus edulis]|uniref:PXDN n=1 Tax=Mytilus edulis TaxID=6550 RepID=A0A8S3Q7T2_MYTED|nr:PXDN [Mytilus edulis]
MLCYRGEQRFRQFGSEGEQIFRQFGSEVGLSLIYGNSIEENRDLNNLVQVGLSLIYNSIAENRDLDSLVQRENRYLDSLVQVGLSLIYGNSIEGEQRFRQFGSGRIVLIYGNSIEGEQRFRQFGSRENRDLDNLVQVGLSLIYGNSIAGEQRFRQFCFQRENRDLDSLVQVGLSLIYGNSIEGEQRFRQFGSEGEQRFRQFGSGKLSLIYGNSIEGEQRFRQFGSEGEQIFRLVSLVQVGLSLIYGNSIERRTRDLDSLVQVGLSLIYGNSIEENRDLDSLVQRENRDLDNLVQVGLLLIYGNSIEENRDLDSSVQGKNLSLIYGFHRGGRVQREQQIFRQFSLGRIVIDLWSFYRGEQIFRQFLVLVKLVRLVIDLWSFYRGEQRFGQFGSEENRDLDSLVQVGLSLIYGNSIEGEQRFRQFGSGHPKSFDATLNIFHVIFLRENDKILRDLKHLGWNGESLYKEARKIMSAVYQHIVYTEYVPAVIGQDAMLRYGLKSTQYGHNTMYNPKTDATTSNVFATAAILFAHSTFDTFEKDVIQGFSPETFQNYSNIVTNSPSSSTLFTRFQSKTDRFMTDFGRNKLWESEPKNSVDTMSFDIQRGRDHGLPSYNRWREYCGLRPILHFGKGIMGFADHTIGATKALSSVYRYVFIYELILDFLVSEYFQNYFVRIETSDDIDLISGAMAERAVSGGIVGPTFACLLGEQFALFKTGDRFFYENDFHPTGFTKGQLRQIKKQSLASVMCRHVNVPTVPQNAFISPKAGKHTTSSNFWIDNNMNELREHEHSYKTKTVDQDNIFKISKCTAYKKRDTTCKDRLILLFYCRTDAKSMKSSRYQPGRAETGSIAAISNWMFSSKYQAQTEVLG